MITQDALTALNPDDIARIIVLKGRVADFIEPAAAGAGLLIITSKKAAGKPEINNFDRYVVLIDCQAAAAPGWQPGQPAPAGARFFLNGAAVSRGKIEQLNARRPLKTEVLTGPQAADFAHDPTALSVLAVTTR